MQLVDLVEIQAVVQKLQVVEKPNKVAKETAGLLVVLYIGIGV